MMATLLFPRYGAETGIVNSSLESCRLRQCNRAESGEPPIEYHCEDFPNSDYIPNSTSVTAVHTLKYTPVTKIWPAGYKRHNDR